MTWFKALSARRSHHEDLAEEMRQHLQEKTEELIATGLGRREAELRAKEFGNTALLLERSNEVWRWPAFDTTWVSLQQAARRLRKAPGFTVTCVLSIAVAIGANAAIFTIDYAALLAPLPYPQVERLVTISSASATDSGFVPMSIFANWKRENHSFKEICAYSGESFVVSANGQLESVFGSRVTPNYYRTFQSSFSLGRGFLDEEGQEGKDAVVILTHRFWQRLGSDPALLGKAILVGGQPRTVVGVLAPGIDDRNLLEVFVPLASASRGSTRNDVALSVVGRLGQGTTFQQAEADLKGISVRNILQTSKTKEDLSVSVKPLRDAWVAMSPEQKQMLWSLMGAVGFVLLLACANIANLFLAWEAAREKEIAVRCALGASRRSIFGQLLAECFLLAGAGGVLGIAVGYVMLRSILSTIPKFTLPWAADVRLNIPVLLFTFMATGLAALIFGLVPAWHGSRVDPGLALKKGGRAGIGLGWPRLQRALVIAEFAIALTLLVGMALAVTSFSNLLRAARSDLRAPLERVLTFDLSRPESRSTDPASTKAFVQAVLERLRSTPGVLAASAQTNTPLYRSRDSASFTFVGTRTQDDLSLQPQVDVGAVTPEYFTTFGVSLVKGRAFDKRDDASGVKTAIVNEAFVHHYVGFSNPLGQVVRVSQANHGGTGTADSTDFEIIGVYRDVRSMGLREDHPEIQTSFWQNVSPGPSFAIRSAVRPDRILRSVAAAVASVDSETPLGSPRTMEQTLDSILGSDRLTMTLFVGFGFVALLLATLGIYGVMSFAVVQRSREIAVRVAVGANRLQVITPLMKQGALLALAGITLGTLGAYFVGHGLQSALFNVPAVDPSILFGVGGLLAFAALAAVFIPAYRAASSDPTRALNSD